MPLIRDRIKELRRVKASDLVQNPKNWRKHPKEQKDALKKVLSKIGYAGALIARELPDGKLMLIDGHLRRDTTPGQDVPVLVLDVTEAESNELLATLDPLSAMAETDQDAYDKLVAEVGGATPPDEEQLEVKPWDLSLVSDLYVVTIRSSLPIATEVKKRLAGLAGVTISENALELT